MQALEIKRGEEQFNKITAIANEAQKRNEKEKDRKYKEALHHRSEILKQVIFQREGYSFMKCLHTSR